MASITNSPGTVVNDSSFGDVAWENLTYAKVSDSSYSALLLSNQTSQYIKATNFGFSVPTGAIIVGIKVEHQIKTTLGTINSFASQIVKNNVAIGTAYSPSGVISTTESYVSTGSESWVWNQSWTAEDINSSGFGVRSNIYIDTKETIFLNHIRITVYYSISTIKGIQSIKGLSTITFK